VEGTASVENFGVQRKSHLPPQRNGEIFLFSRLLEKPQASPKGGIITSATSRTGEFPQYF